MEPGACIDCGATIRVKPKTPGICPYCGANIATGDETFRAIEPLEEPARFRSDRRRGTRIFGALQLGIGVVFIVVFAASKRFMPTFIAALFTAHGLFRLLFASGPRRTDDDYDPED